MHIRKTRVFALIIVILLIVQMLLGLRYAGKDCGGIAGLKVRAGAPASLVLLRYGLPDERYVNRETDLRSYTYNDEELFGQKATIEFYMARLRAYWIRATIQEDPEEVYELACESIRKANEDLEGFAIRPTDDGCEMGSPLGPPFANTDLSLLEDRLVIDLTEQRS